MGENSILGGDLTLKPDMAAAKNSPRLNAVVVLGVTQKKQRHKKKAISKLIIVTISTYTYTTVHNITRQKNPIVL